MKFAFDDTDTRRFCVDFLKKRAAKYEHFMEVWQDLGFVPCVDHSLRYLLDDHFSGIQFELDLLSLVSEVVL